MRFTKCVTALFAVIVAGSSCNNGPKSQAGYARDVIERTVGHRARNIEYRLTDKTPDGCDRFSTEVRDGKLILEGSSGTALARAFYDYLTVNGYGQVTWTGKRVELPRRLPDTPRREVTSPFRHHYYMNVCTFGYTYPYWDWKQWEKEIDWMALHGFDMPLAPIAGEAILARALESIGLTSEEINGLFTAPGHLPWMRMGNMSALDSPLSQEWLDEQVELQHRILDRLRGLGMKPIFNGFAGFVPRALKRVRPQAELTETQWNGHMKSWMLSVESPVFAEIAALYMREWEKEFGKGEFYLVDSFNEMDLPFGDLPLEEVRGLLTQYGKAIYESINAVNPDAVWVLQGWMFGYQRHIWTPDNIRALLAGVPDDRVMILDLAEDFNSMVWRNAPAWEYADGFFGKQWTYSTVPNFGGRSALTGSLEFYANGHLAALHSAQKGNLVGYGTAPEGVENNDAVYEMIADAGWSDSEIDVNEWVKRYSRNRYGAYSAELDGFWENMLLSSHSVSSPNQVRYRWQMTPYYHRRGLVDLSPEYFAAAEHFISAADELAGSELYMADLALHAALYAAGKADLAIEAVNWNYVYGNTDAAREDRKYFEDLLGAADRFLLSTPNHRLERWLGFADARGNNPEEKDRYGRNARRLVTVWSDGASLHDYSCRVWSGLIRDYVIPRWALWFDAKDDGGCADFSGFEREWLSGKELSYAVPYGSVPEAARELVSRYSSYASDFTAPESNGIIGSWSPFELNGKESRIRLTLDPETIPSIRGVKFKRLRGGGEVSLGKVVLQIDRKNVFSSDETVKVSPENDTGAIFIKNPEKAAVAEGAIFISIESSKAADSYGIIELLR